MTGLEYEELVKLVEKFANIFSNIDLIELDLDWLMELYAMFLPAISVVVDYFGPWFGR